MRQRSPRAVFEKLLPFAIALEVEEAWSHQLKDVYQPIWYESNEPLRLGTYGALYGLSSGLSSQVNDTISATQDTTSSGSGGGGFSGGGGGGGGGGGW